MRGVRDDGRIAQLRAAGIVEVMDARGIAREGLRRRDILDADLGPDAIGVAEGGQPAFATDPGASEDDKAWGGLDDTLQRFAIIAERKPLPHGRRGAR